MPLLEVIRTAEVAPEVVATAVAVGKRQGKTVIVVGDGVGFYTSRILGPYLNEATWLLMEGVAIDVIDRALVAWGFPIGPMTLLDEVGLDVAAHVGPVMIEAFGHRVEPPEAVRKLADDGRKGKKSGRGFYRYDGAKARGRPRRVDESVYALLGLEVPSGPPRVMVEELQMRCALALANEAFHCLGDGILSCPRDGDIGAIFGLGFPPFRGGPFRYADAVGAAELLGRIERYHARFGARWAPAPALVDLAARGARIYA
jgi:3-hydroxyacyl-CoA dehydrogenase / enoyl-CoA hydratase / 3-hydroxybutyryl-CoA epimerase